MKSRQWLLIAAGVIVIVAGAIFYFLNQSNTPTISGTASTGASTVSTTDLMVPGPLGDKALGDPKAPNIVIEYASMTCTHCQRFNAEVFKPFKAKYIDTGKVYYIFREFPLDPLAKSASALARCAPADAYFPIVDLLFEKQDQWAFVPDPLTALRTLMKQVGFSQDSFDACLKDPKIASGLDEVRQRASDHFGVSATPTFFFNGKREEGEQTMAQIDKLLGG
jgi:protein-disulfide isomerase